MDSPEKSVVIWQIERGEVVTSVSINQSALLTIVTRSTPGKSGYGTLEPGAWSNVWRNLEDNEIFLLSSDPGTGDDDLYAVDIRDDLSGKHNRFEFGVVTLRLNERYRHICDTILTAPDGCTNWVTESERTTGNEGAAGTSEGMEHRIGRAVDRKLSEATILRKIGSEERPALIFDDDASIRVDMGGAQFVKSITMVRTNVPNGESVPLTIDVGLTTPLTSSPVLTCLYPPAEGSRLDNRQMN